LFDNLSDGHADSKLALFVFVVTTSVMNRCIIPDPSPDR